MSVSVLASWTCNQAIRLTDLRLVQSPAANVPIAVLRLLGFFHSPLMRFQPCRSDAVVSLVAGAHMEQLCSKVFRKAASSVVVVLLFAGIAAAQTPAVISLEQAIDLALTHSHTLKAARTQIQQNQAQEITASLRPNPTLLWDALFIPVFSPQYFSLDTLNNIQQFDMGLSYLYERGGKRQRRVDAARDATGVTRYLVSDSERSLIFNVAQQFIDAQLAASVLDFAVKDLNSFEQTVRISEDRYKAGDISEGDLLKIKLQLLQFQTDVAGAQVAKVQALASLRQLLGFDAVPTDYELQGELAYQPLSVNLDDLRVRALKLRPDLLAAQQGVRAAQSQIALAKANGKVDLTTTAEYTHVSDLNSLSMSFAIPLAVFDRNQGEIARTRFALTQSQENAEAASDAVLTDVRNNYEAFSTNQKIVQLYLTGYLKQAQDSRDISEYAYKRGAASLLDFLDAERSYRSTQLSYRQALANYLLSIEQLKESVGTRTLP
jgi:cobalt-zinc-cadmium efflux system outer membrane protein